MKRTLPHRGRIHPAQSAPALLLTLCLTACGIQGSAPQAEVYVSEESLSENADAAAETFAPRIVSADVPVDMPIVPPVPEATASAAGNTSPGQDASANAAESKNAASSAEAEDEEDYLEILFLGDSQFSNARGTGTEIPAVVRRYLGEDSCKVYDLSISGTSAALKRSERDMALADWSSASFLGMAYLLNGDVSSAFLDRQYPDVAKVFHTIDKSRLDYIVVDYGINDFLGVAEINDDEDDDDYSEFGPAYLKSLRTLNKACPQATILCCTPCYAQFFARDGAYLGDGNTLSNGYGFLVNYTETIDANYRMAENAYYLDMYHGSCMDLDAYTASKYLSDGIHLTERGRQVYGVVITRVIGKLLGFYTEEWRPVRIDEDL